MQKVKWFLVANQEVSFGNVDTIQNCFAPFDRKMFNVQTVNCMQYSELVVIQESNSVAIMQWNEYKLRTLTSKTQWFALIEEKLFGP